jgi:soluble lytic murein transglycosylase-like protein
MRKLVVIACLLSFVSVVARAESLPTILSEPDVENYKQLFDLQDAGKFDAAMKLESKIENKILMGDVLYQRYMSPKYYSRGVEIAEWMNKYYNNPGAENMFKLSKKKRVLSRAPAVPSVANSKTDNVAYSESLTMKKYYGITGQKLGQFQRLVRKRKTLAAKNILIDESFKKNISFTDYGRLCGRLAFAYYNDGRFDSVETWGKIGAERSSEMALWTMGLLSYKNENYADAQMYFEKMLDLTHINTNRKIEAAFWAGRAAEANDDSRKAREHWKFAMTRPASFYGAMSAAMLGRDPDYEFYEEVISSEDIEELMKTKYGMAALALLQIGKKDLAENQLKYLITKNAGDNLLHAVHALAASEELPRVAMQIAPVIKDRGILEIDSNVILSAQFPIPEWEPRGGWNIDRALLFAIARQESGFKANAKSHAGATGLLQLMPRTAKITAVRKGIKMKTLNLTNPSDSMFLGQQHVLDLFALSNVDNNIVKMLVSYNAGNGSQRKFERKFETNDPLLYIESFPAAETRQYVKMVMSNLWLYRARLGQPMTNLDDLASGRWPRYASEDDFASRDKDTSDL